VDQRCPGHPESASFAASSYGLFARLPVRAELAHGALITEEGLFFFFCFFSIGSPNRTEVQACKLDAVDALLTNS